MIDLMNLPAEEAERIAYAEGFPMAAQLFDRIELQIARDDAESASHPGPCDADVARLRNVPYIREQLDRLSPALVAECLREYGAWDAEELTDHDTNLDRLLWCACCDISEEVSSIRAAMVGM